MSFNKFQKATSNKFGQIPTRRDIVPLTTFNEEEVISPFDMTPNEDFSSAICLAIPIWEVLKLSEEEYNEKYCPIPAVEEIILPLDEEEINPPFGVEETKE